MGRLSPVPTSNTVDDGVFCLRCTFAVCLRLPSFARQSFYQVSVLRSSYRGESETAAHSVWARQASAPPHVLVFLFVTGGNFIFALEFHRTCVSGATPLSILHVVPTSARRRWMRLWKIDSISYGKLFVCVRITLSPSLPFAAVSAHFVSPPLPPLPPMSGASDRACLCNLGTVPPPHYLQLYHKIGGIGNVQNSTRNVGIPDRTRDSSLDFLSKRAESPSPPSVGRTSPINPFPLLKVTATALLLLFPP